MQKIAVLIRLLENASTHHPRALIVVVVVNTKERNHNFAALPENICWIRGSRQL